jgi:Zn-dependent protease with chaperone function
MDIPWRNVPSLIRFCPVRTATLFAVACIVSPSAAKEDCAIRDVESVRKLDLDACRPAPVSIAERARVLQSLPVNGVVTQLGRGERRKLEAVGKVLRAHGRSGVYDVKVISVPQAWTGLYERAVLLISLPVLTLLSSEEVEALVAHEIGHEYVWQQYADAKAHRDTRGIRELELVCDAIATRTLKRVSIAPERLQTATEKISWYNRERLGVALDQGKYPSINERRRVIKQMSLLER